MLYMYLKRIAEVQLQTILSGPKVGIVLGARQVGKTTLLEHCLASKNAAFLNLDVETDKSRLLAAGALAPKEGLASLGDPEILVIDEAQRLPETARMIKGWYDVRLPVKVLLLGSSSLNLLDQTAESLTGRNEKLRLPPLVFEETLSSQSWCNSAYTAEVVRTRFADPVRALLMQLMAFGSYPEVVLTSDKPRLLRELSSDYLWKDILQTGLVKSPDLIKRLLMLLAHQIGNEVSTHELATQLQIARPTVDRYLDLLEQTFVIFRLPSYSTNPRKEVVRGKKIYFWDTGIRNALLNAFATEQLRPDVGVLWENWVISEVAKHNQLRGCPCDLFFWRSRAQSEVDLVVRTGDRLKAFEVKWQKKRVRANRAFKGLYGVDVGIITPENPFVASCLD